jgi:hypothetical protein
MTGVEPAVIGGPEAGERSKFDHGLCPSEELLRPYVALAGSADNRDKTVSNDRGS